MTANRWVDARRLVVIGALVAAAFAATAAYRVHRARSEAATINKQLNRLAAPAPTRAPVSLRPDGR